MLQQVTSCLMVAGPPVLEQFITHGIEVTCNRERKFSSSARSLLNLGDSSAIHFTPFLRGTCSPPDTAAPFA